MCARSLRPMKAWPAGSRDGLCPPLCGCLTSHRCFQVSVIYSGAICHASGHARYAWPGTPRIDKTITGEPMEATARNLLDMEVKPQGYYSGLRKDMLPYVPRSTRRLLEVGCAEGAFSSQLKGDRGLEAWGVEMNSTAAQVAASRLDKVVHGRAEDVLDQIPDSYFDCIVCNDVLEHIYDPYSLLLALKGKLAADGVLVASIPNIRYYKVLGELLFKRQWRYADSGVLDKTHVRFFTRESLREMSQELGLDRKS